MAETDLWAIRFWILSYLEEVQEQTPLRKQRIQMLASLRLTILQGLMLNVRRQALKLIWYHLSCCRITEIRKINNLKEGFKNDYRFT